MFSILGACKIETTCLILKVHKFRFYMGANSETSLSLEIICARSTGQPHHCTCKGYHMQVVGFLGQNRVLHWFITDPLPMLQSHQRGHTSSGRFRYSCIPTPTTYNPRTNNGRPNHSLHTLAHRSHSSRLVTQPNQLPTTCN